MTNETKNTDLRARIEELEATIAAAIYELEERGGTYATQVLRGQIDYKSTLEARLAEVTAERDLFKASWLNAGELAEAALATARVERDAAIPRAYAMGLEDATECIGHITQSEDHEAIRALTPPDDLVERVLKGGE